ncbi:MAG TPA: hypothetical protein VJB57_13010 [Dehalococcoidia bacterium]|nr:hypothetical protein [Dehalococcoidia bacterium]
MPTKLSRRLFLRRALAVGTLCASIGGVEVARKGLDLLEQHRTWIEASYPNGEFLARNAPSLERLTLGTSFAPEQFRRSGDGAREALNALDFAVRDLGMSEVRLGLRWNRTLNREGAIDLSFYRPYLDYCLSRDIDICLNLGPIRVFRWPEEHVPQSVLSNLSRVPPTDATITTGEPLAQEALKHLERLQGELISDYGDDLLTRVSVVQVENEPFYELGQHRWRFGAGYLREVALRLIDSFSGAAVLVTSAGRLHLHLIRDLFAAFLASDDRFGGHLVSGFDFHYKTPLRDSYPVIRHFDQLSYARPLAPTPEEHVRDARDLGFRIEVTEGQAEPYGHLRSPGNSARDLRFLILRLMDKVLDPRQSALIRLWGVEELAKRLLRNEATEEHRQMVEVIQAVNAGQSNQLSVQEDLKR